jgi:hypothetical protein
VLLLVLALVSLGILAGLAVVLRRQREAQLQGEPATEESAGEAADAAAEASPEPISAT